VKKDMAPTQQKKKKGELAVFCSTLLFDLDFFKLLMMVVMVILFQFLCSPYMTEEREMRFHSGQDNLVSLVWGKTYFRGSILR
jgi:hypothetical protein